MLSLLALSAAATLVAAGPFTPTGPSPGQVFKEGGDCTVEWNADTTGKYKEVDVFLMSGSNLDMVKLEPVTTISDPSSSTTTFTYPCPSVTPNAPIYFYQFESGSNAVQWTGRFTIAAADGTTTNPTNTTSGIQWGSGQLVGAGSTVGNTTSSGSATGNSSMSTSSGDSSSQTSANAGRTETTTVTQGGSNPSATGNNNNGAGSLRTSGAAALALLAAGAFLL